MNDIVERLRRHADYLWFSNPALLERETCDVERSESEHLLLEAAIEIERLITLLTPKPLDENAPKDRELIGVDRPPYEDRTYYRMIEWREDEQRWMTQCGVDWATRQYIWAFCGVTHYLDPQELPGLPYYDGSDIEVDEWDEEEQQ